MTTATQLLWGVKFADGYLSIIDETGKEIVGWDRATVDEPDAANALKIVRAVNAHAALVEAAENAIDDLEDNYDGAPDGPRWMGRHIAALRAALALAKGN